jgi:hypothetical protein
VRALKIAELGMGLKFTTGWLWGGGGVLLGGALRKGLSVEILLKQRFSINKRICKCEGMKFIGS